MAVIKVETGRDVAAPPQHVFACIADFATRRPRWLPPNYSDLTVEHGGSGDGTLVRYRLKVGPRERLYHMQIREPEPGQTVLEEDTESSMRIRWSVTPRGAESHVTVTGQWQGAGGIGGFMERMFAPGGFRHMLDDALARLAQYATSNVD
jgi:hypothetical protein